MLSLPLTHRQPLTRITHTPETLNHEPYAISHEQPLQERLQHPALTLECCASQGLPGGWEEGKTADGKAFFIDHNSATTHWELR